MLELDRAAIETLLVRLEKGGYLFPRYQFYKVNDHLQFLGKGGFSAVYEMEDKSIREKHYAVKVMGLERHIIPPDTFQRTIVLQRHLSGQSPYILRIIDVRELGVVLDENGELLEVYEQNGKDRNEESITLQFILMEKLECILVKDRFKNTTLIRDALQEESEILKFAIQIGQAILTAHNNNVLHRDIKLENIFWDSKEKCYKLGDFGIAKYVEGGNAETIVFTDGYGAPEIERRLSNSYNVTADIYSFGISLYLLLNELTFPGSGGYYVNLVQYDPDFTFPAPRKASDELTRVIRKMCSYRREERYQSMEEVLFDLRYVSEMEVTLEEDCTELADIATETYRDENAGEKEEENKGSAALEGTINVSRALRKRKQKEIDEKYGRACIWYLIGISMLFAFLMKGMQADVSFAAKWQFWVLPIAVFVTAVMQRIRDLHIVSGTAVILFGVYSIYVTGFHVPHFILLVCVMMGVPVLTAASAMGTGIWMMFFLTDRIPWLGLIREHDLVWIVIAITLIMVDRLMRLRWKSGKSVYNRMLAWANIYGPLSFCMMIAGVIFLLLQHFEIMVLPEFVHQLHLIRMGIVLFAVSVLEVSWDEELERKTEKIREDGEEIAENNVHMDE